MGEFNKKPSIRFAGFTDAWEQRKVGDIADRFDNLRIPVAANLRIHGTTPYYGANGIQDYVKGFTHEGEFVLIAEDGANDLKNYPVKCVNGRIWVNNHAHVLQSKGTIANNQFLSYSLHMADIESLLVGGGRAKLNSETLMNLVLTVPSLTEQTCIGSFLCSIDSLITLHQRKYEALKKVKKSFLQKMFPKEGEKFPEIRFPGFTDAWEQRRLGEVFEERLERATGEEELLSVTIGYGVIRQSDSDKRNTASEDKSNYKIVRKGDVPYNSMRMWQGAVGHSEYDGIVSPAYTVLAPTSEVSGKFFMELFKRESTLKILQRWSQGLTPDTWNLKYPTLSTLKFSMPSIDEQRQIASFFEILDSVITLHQRKLEKLKNIKKSCLEKMFV